MSTTVDERVVSMQFDNKQFEANVKTSLGTLDKLKQSLNFTGAAKGLDNVNNAVKNVNMNPLSNGVEAVRMKFSALDVMAVTALSNITNSAVNAGKRIVSALTIDPIKTGFSEYETKINAIQTIMSNTASKGTTMADVTKVIDELNTYADRTIYNFAEMTRNIGTFTAAGVGLEDSAAAIQGIANLAAASGSNSQQASTAMYQLSQALAAGTVKLMDWNSVVNAGMGGEKFQNALKQTAREMGIAVDDIIKKNGSFRESLSEGWISAEVLNTTLKKFTKEGAAEYAEAMVKSGKYTEEQAEALKKEAESMDDAATKVKTFTQLWDTLKESVQSGWGKTWELVVGNFEQAKETLTQISDILTGPDSFLTKSADSRNKFLEETLGSNWDKLVARLGEAGIEADKFDDTLRKTLEAEGKDVDDLVDKYGSLSRAFTSGNLEANILRKTIENLSKKTVDLSKVNRLLWWGHQGEDVTQVQEALKALGYELGEKGIDGIIGTDTQDAIRKFQKDKGLKVDGLVGDKTLAALKEAAALTEEVDKNSKILIKDYEDLISVINKPAGRELLLGSLKNVLEAIMKLLNVVGDAWSEVFSLDASEVYSFIEGLHNFTKALVMNDETADKLKRTLKGVLSILKVITTIVGGAVKIAFTGLKSVLSKLDLGFLDVTASIGDGLVKFKDNVENSIGDITDFIIDGIGSWISQFKETALFKTCAEYFEGASEIISKAIDNIVNGLDDFDTSKILKQLEKFGKFLSDIVNAIANSELFVAIVDGVLGALSKLAEFVRGFKLPEFNLDSLTSFSKFGSIFDEGKIGGFSGALTKIGEYFRGLGQFNWETFKNTAIEKFTKFWLKVGDKAKLAFEKGKEIALAITEFLFGTTKIDLPTIMDAVSKFLGIILLIKAIDALSNFTSPFENISSALDNLAASLKWDAMANAFKSMALALGVLTVCIVIISRMPVKGALTAAGILAGLLLVMGGIVIALGVCASKIDGWDTAGAVAALLMMVVSLMLLVKTIEEIDNLQLKNPAKTFGMLFLTLLALSTGVKTVSKAAGSSFKSVAAILTLVAALKMILQVIDAYDRFDWSGKTSAIYKMANMLILLSVSINLASRGVKAGSNAKGLALLLLAMVVSLKILLSVMEDFAAMDTDTLVKGGLTVVALLSVMTGLAFALGRANKGTVLEKGQKSVNNFTGLAIALLAVVGAIWLLGKMDINTLKQGGIAVAGILAAFTVMLGVVGKSCSGLKMGTIITMLIMIGVLMAELAIIIAYMKSIPLKQSLSSAGALGGLLLAISLVMRTISKTRVQAKTIVKWIGAMTALAGILVLLAYVLHQLKDVNPANSIGNMVALSGLMAAMAGVLVTLAKHRNGAKSIYKWIGAMATLGLVVAELAVVLHLVKGLNPVESIGNIVALSGLMFAMAGVLTILTKHRTGAKSIYKWIGAMATLGLVAAELAIVLHMIKGLDPAESIGNVAALSILMIAMAGVLTVVNLIKVDGKAFLGILGLAAVAASLFILVEVLRNMQGIGDARDNAITLALLAGALSLCLIPIAAVGALASGMTLIGVVALAGIMASLFIVVEVLRSMQGIGDARDNAITLALLAGVLSLCMIPLAIAGSMAAGAIIGVASLAVLMAALFIVVEVLRSMQGIENASRNATILAQLTTVLTLLMIPLGLIGLLGPAAIIGVGSLAVLMASLFIVVGVLATMQNIQNAQASADILIQLLTTMTAALVQISLLAPLAVVGVGAMSVLVALVAKLGVMVAAVGALMEWCPSIEDFIDNGLELFKKLATGLGEMLSAFMVGATSGLGEVGTNLSTFMENAQYFIDNVGKIDQSVINGAGYLAGAIVALLIADFISAIASLGGMSLADLGTDLSNFAENIGGFITAMSSIDNKAATGVTALCDTINALTSANLKDAITQILPGDNSLENFGANIEAFASAIQNASIYLANITDDDVANIKRSAAAGEALAELNKSIPGQGGIVQTLLGEQDLATWGRSIDAFASCLISYSAKVSGQNIDVEAIKASATAGTAISELNGKIPKSGGWAQDILGEQDLATWGKSIVEFARCLVNYSNIVSSGTFNTEAITASASAADALADLNGKIPKAGGWAQEIMGQQDLATFGASLVTFGNGLKSYSTSVSGIDESKITAINNSGAALDALLVVMDKIPTTGGWKEKLFGSQNGQTFGDSLASMAKGIKDYCATAATISESDITAITNSGTAITTLGQVLSLVPETSECQKAANLATAVNHLNTMITKLSSIGENGYSNVGMSYVRTAVNSLNALFTSVDTSTFVSDASLIKSASTYIENAGAELAKLSGYTFSGVYDFKNAIADLAETDIDSAINAFANKATSMSVSINTLINAMSTALAGGATTIDTSMSGLVDVALKAVTNKKDAFTTAGQGLLSSLVSGLEDTNSSMLGAGSTLGSYAVSGARSQYGSMLIAANYLAQGFIRGLNAAHDAVKEASRNLAEAAADGIRVTLIIQSPSKLAEMFGAYTGEGFVNGLNAYTGRAYDAGTDLGNGAATGLSDTISKISDAVSGDMDMTPTIRPVVDLSNVNAGADAINSLFGGKYALGANPHLGAISALMNGGKRNSNDDVIAAIRDLNNSLSGMGNTYTINGITYDDGSGVAEAIRTITRAAKLERRV